MPKQKKDIELHNFFKENDSHYQQFRREIMSSSSNNGYKPVLKKIFGKLDKRESLTEEQHQSFWRFIKSVRSLPKKGIPKERALNIALQRLNQNKGLSSGMIQSLSSTSNEKAGTPVSLREKQKSSSRKREREGARDSSNLISMEEPESSSSKRARTGHSFDMSSGGKQKSSSTTTAKNPVIQNDIKRLIRPVASAIKEIVRPYTGLLSITELNSIIVQEVVLNSSQQSTSRSMPQPPNTRLQPSSYRGPSLQPYSTVPPLQPYSTVPPRLPPYSTVPPRLPPYSTVPPRLPPYSTAPPRLPPYSTVPPRQFLNTGSLNMMNNSNSNTGPRPNRNPMTGAPPMPYSTAPPHQLPKQDLKKMMQQLKYKNRNRNTMMRSHPPQAGRDPMIDSNNAPPNMKNP